MTETDDPHAKAVASYSNEKLTAIIETPGTYDPKLVVAANREAKWRGIQRRHESTSSRTSQESHLTLVRQKMGVGASKEICEEYLRNEGLSKEGALFILNKAIELGPLKIVAKPRTQEEGCGISFWFVIVTILSLIKLITLIAK